MILNESKRELQIKIALMEYFCDVSNPKNYGVDSYSDLLTLIRNATKNGDEIHASNGEKLQHIDIFFDLKEALVSVEYCIEVLDLYDQALQALSEVKIDE